MISKFKALIKVWSLLALILPFYGELAYSSENTSTQEVCGTVINYENRIQRIKSDPATDPVVKRGLYGITNTLNAAGERIASSSIKFSGSLIADSTAAREAGFERGAHFGFYLDCSNCGISSSLKWQQQLRKIYAGTSLHAPDAFSIHH